MGRVAQSRMMLVIALVMVPVWVGLHLWIFHAGLGTWKVPSAMFGPLLWAFPMGAYLGSRILKRRNIWWVFLTAVPLSWGILYVGFTLGLWAENPARWTLSIDPRIEPGHDNVSIALMLCFVPAAGVAFAFVSYPRRPVDGSDWRCIGCGYDVRGSIAQGRCPECGRELVMGVDYPYPNRVPPFPTMGTRAPGET